jgi:hypothetical protein
MRDGRCGGNIHECVQAIELSAVLCCRVQKRPERIVDRGGFWLDQAIAQQAAHRDNTSAAEAYYVVVRRNREFLHCTIELPAVNYVAAEPVSEPQPLGVSCYFIKSISDESCHTRLECLLQICRQIRETQRFERPD